VIVFYERENVVGLNDGLEDGTFMEHVEFDRPVRLLADKSSPMFVFFWHAF
jgi:hypothetical protein